MRLHYLMHSDFAHAGAILNWASSRNCKLSHTKMYLNENLPNLADFDALIVLGGPQNLVCGSVLASFSGELKFIKSCIQQGKPILGICLGAQLVNLALGGKTQKSPLTEIGPYNLQISNLAKQCPLFVDLDALPVLHWHSNMAVLPESSTLLASSKTCPVQAFSNKRVFGLQFHLELTHDILQHLIKTNFEYLHAQGMDGVIETLENIDLSPYHQTLYKILDRFSALI